MVKQENKIVREGGSTREERCKDYRGRLSGRRRACIPGQEAPGKGEGPGARDYRTRTYGDRDEPIPDLRSDQSDHVLKGR